jgi:glycosyltransferase involved in cell wall biosynthesis
MKEQHLEPQHYPLSIVIPLCNEADNVRPMVDEIMRVVNLPCFEIIFVDDGSTDATWQQLQQLKASNASLQIAQHSRNFGQSVALITGIKMAKHPWIVTLDGDGQNDPADISKLLQYHAQLSQSNPDTQPIILGVRAVRNDNWLRRLSTKIARFIRKACLQDDCPDSGCAIKLFHRQQFLSLPLFKNMHRFLPILFKRAGFQTHNTPVNHRCRQHGVTKYGVMNRLWVGLFDLVGVYWLLRRPIITAETPNA